MVFQAAGEGHCCVASRMVFDEHEQLAVQPQHAQRHCAASVSYAVHAISTGTIAKFVAGRFV
jgi:hypothetical protein